jgi:hypothetical protein
LLAFAPDQPLSRLEAVAQELKPLSRLLAVADVRFLRIVRNPAKADT